MLRAFPAIALTVLAAGCVQVPEGAYFPGRGAGAAPMAQILYRAARAAGDEPERYSFAFVRSREVRAWSADDATFYFSEGLLYPFVSGDRRRSAGTPPTTASRA